MASPPFSITETAPGNADVVSNFPAIERAFRETVESWLLLIADTYGHAKLKQDSTTNRDADTWNAAGALFWNTTVGALQRVVSTGPVVWGTISIPSGTKMAFHQSTAPTGWTKITDAAYNDAAIRLTTGTITPTGGTKTFTDAFTSRTISQANLPNVTLAGTALAAGAHKHNVNAPTGSGTLGGFFGYGLGSVETDEEPNHTHNVEVSLGGSGTGMDFAVKYVDFIVATKD